MGIARQPRINGVEKRYESFQALYDSREMRMMRGIMQVTGSNAYVRAFEAHIKTKIEAERGSSDATFAKPEALPR